MKKQQNRNRRRPRRSRQGSRNRGTKSSQLLFPKGSARAIGREIGRALGGPPGAYLGSQAGDLFSRVTGMGDYKVQGNTLLSSSPPMFRQDSGKIRIAHREFLGEVLSNTTIAGAFSAAEYRINPGDSTTFPWLSTVGPSWTEYEFKGLIFSFKSTSGTAVGSTNTALGAVVMATQYDVKSPPFSSRRDMEQHQFSSSGASCENILHPVECDPTFGTVKNLLVRTAVEQVNIEDPRFHDKGTFTIATVGQQALGVSLGELWVTYDIEFSLPRHSLSPVGISRFLSSNITAGNALNMTEIGLDPNNTVSCYLFATSVILTNGVGAYKITYDVRRAGTGNINISTGLLNGSNFGGTSTWWLGSTGHNTMFAPYPLPVTTADHATFQLIGEAFAPAASILLPTITATTGTMSATLTIEYLGVAPTPVSDIVIAPYQPPPLSSDMKAQARSVYETTLKLTSTRCTGGEPAPELDSKSAPVRDSNPFSFRSP